MLWALIDALRAGDVMSTQGASVTSEVKISSLYYY